MEEQIAILVRQRTRRCRSRRSHCRCIACCVRPRRTTRLCSSAAARFGRVSKRCEVSRRASCMRCVADQRAIKNQGLGKLCTTVGAVYCDFAHLAALDMYGFLRVRPREPSAPHLSSGRLAPSRNAPSCREARLMVVACAIAHRSAGVVHGRASSQSAAAR